MLMPSPTLPDAEENLSAKLNMQYVWMIASVAALGGLLFGYDWVVIGGAKTFYETYFHLSSDWQVGWANSCALLGCLGGSILAGRLSETYGRKRLLIISAVLFTASSILTGWAHSFAAFIIWRIVGGIAIGVASIVSPIYIAEISPAAWRGRLVSLNQLAIVVGILAAQIVNWKIAEAVPAKITSTAFLNSWNVQLGWRWMFTAVALPGAVFIFASLLIPESPRWQIGRLQIPVAERTLLKIGGHTYMLSERKSIQSSLDEDRNAFVSFRELLLPGMKKLLLIGIVLAVLQQWSGINILFNYAEEIYRNAGYGVSDVMFNIVITGAINLLFTLVAIGCVDRFGRRPLMLCGMAGVGLSHLLVAFAYWRGVRGLSVLILTLMAIAWYALSLAPVTWVLITEIFPNRIRGLAVSVSICALWLASFLLTYTFPVLNRVLGIGGTFAVYGIICFSGFLFFFRLVPETRGISLDAKNVK